MHTAQSTTYVFKYFLKLLLESNGRLPFPKFYGSHYANLTIQSKPRFQLSPLHVLELWSNLLLNFTYAAIEPIEPKIITYNLFFLRVLMSEA